MISAGGKLCSSQDGLSETEERERVEEREGKGYSERRGEGGHSAQHAAVDWISDSPWHWRDFPPDRCGDLEEKSKEDRWKGEGGRWGKAQEGFFLWGE